MIAFTLTPVLWLVIDALAVFRLTRLVTADIITDRPRRWVLEHLGTGWFDFVTCAWCVSMWIAGVVVLLTALAPTEWKYVAYVLTLSAVAGLLAARS
ncbi:MAG: DUF1360 domain-containing protein [Rhodospirillales bacterium]|nr:DUF1360 domain-containing protein [Rhodospirillales bacterium]